MSRMVPVELDQPRVHHIPAWDRMGDRERVAFLRRIAEPAGRDPRIRYLAHTILRDAGVDQRQYERQADALLRWIHKNIAYLNEPGEILQDCLYTIKVAHGDCDDMALLMGALCESLRLPWRFVLSGIDKLTGEKKRWIEATPFPHGVQMAHIYVVVGWPPYKPTTWAYAEPTIKNVPLGWDVVAAAAGASRHTPPLLPELSGPGPYGRAPEGSALVPSTSTSAAMQAAVAVEATASALRERDVFDLDQDASFVASILNKSTFRTILVASAVGAFSTVLAQLVLDALRAPRARKKKD
jgi:hypothetical protein